ncbi:hypothetical protein F6U93_01810 [Tamlana haliotis]|uniref:Trypsin-like peptidase domain-containing protein n=1 Tax=Pseudotamlana haliotis TaxID=2614804 RepID=A0A6N6MPU9_9FLAO|nr:hypothetical protein [Tamlana haliotis]KAB1070541.1 hypothetical protein F6U93_01810 [Tamlana haliotis]
MSKIINPIDYHQEIQMDASRDAYLSTCHYLTVENGIPEPHATGVFIKIFDYHFLFTAAHVADGLLKSISVGIEKHKTVQLGGEWTINKLSPNEKREEDKIDIAILKLDNESIEYVKKQYSFLNHSELGINHEVKELPYYTAIGFPCSKNKFNKFKNKLDSKPFIFNTMPAKPEIYSELNCKPFLNLIVHYDKKNVIDYEKNLKITGPDPFGISGGGLWHVPVQLVEKGNKVNKKLVAILSEWPSKNRKFWICTRIDVFTEVVRKKYNLDIETSKIIKLDTE